MRKGRVEILNRVTELFHQPLIDVVWIPDERDIGGEGHDWLALACIGLGLFVVYNGWEFVRGALA